MGGIVNYPTSDLQFIAQVLKKVRAGDQVTVDEGHRLDQIAEHGYSTTPTDPSGGGT